MDSWPKVFQLRLNGWAAAREAAIELGLSFIAEQRMAHALEKVTLAIEVTETGDVKVGGTTRDQQR
jgi:hypothetical protein